MPTIPNAPLGEDTASDGTEKIPVSGSKYMLVSTIAEYIRTLAQTLTNKTLTTPTVADFTNAQHNHSNAANGGAITHIKGGTIATPGTYYTTVGAVVPIYQAPAALTITKIIVRSDDSTPTSEIAGDLKFADDVFTGSLANAAVIDVCDTTSGSFEATSAFDDATVPSGKYIYFQFDSAPHADHKRVLIQFNFTFD